MAPAWWITNLILALYAVNFVWLLALSKPWAAGYWFCAIGITICAMKGLA